MRLVVGLSTVVLAALTRVAGLAACGGVNMSDDQRLPARAAAGDDDSDDSTLDSGRDDSGDPQSSQQPTIAPAPASDAGASSDSGTSQPVPAGSFAAGTDLETTADLNLREGPGTEFNIILTIPVGTVVKVETTSGADGWVKVDDQGTVGYASKMYLKVP